MDWQTSVEEGMAIYEVKKENQELIKQEVAIILTSNFFHKLPEEINKIIGSYLKGEDIPTLSRLIVPSSNSYQEDYEKITALLKGHKENTLEKINSNALDVTGKFIYDFLGGMDGRLDPSTFVKRRNNDNKNHSRLAESDNNICTIL